ncbi:unnamed protein product [Miscanthus lutarioriparius]|uniref:Uncharacterized protein n=1 Tax=Miscanthus lutarioriparius TaxID=422564 RepID=A0A811RHR6_9POAL|nr:unnamed protein product [Miscanthus lutarioriparius]
MGRGQQSQPAASSSSTVPKLMAECYDVDSSELVFPGRGRISVNADSVCRAFGLPNNGDEVKYELDVGAINFINAISPRCYLAIVDLSCVKKLNWCRFVVDQLKDVATKMGKRRSFKGCLLVLVILYVDSLLVDNVKIPSTMLRVAAWSRKLLDQVIKLDTNRDDSFGKLKLKGSSYSTP